MGFACVVTTQDRRDAESLYSPTPARIREVEAIDATSTLDREGKQAALQKAGTWYDAGAPESTYKEGTGPEPRRGVDTFLRSPSERATGGDRSDADLLPQFRPRAAKQAS